MGVKVGVSLRHCCHSDCFWVPGLTLSNTRLFLDNDRGPSARSLQPIRIGSGRREAACDQRKAATDLNENLVQVHVGRLSRITKVIPGGSSWRHTAKACTAATARRSDQRWTQPAQAAARSGSGRLAAREVGTGGGRRRLQHRSARRPRPQQRRDAPAARSGIYADRLRS